MVRRVLAVVGVLVVLHSPLSAATDVVLTWNEQMVKTLVGQSQSPFAQARFAAIVQLAVFEAVNAITGEYQPYIGMAAPPGASADAAAATAAYRVLKNYFPAAPDIDALFGEGGHTIVMTNPLVPAIAGLVFNYSTFNEICDDVDDARIYGGIHYQFDQTAGNKLGREVGTYVVKNNLKRLHGPND